MSESSASEKAEEVKEEAEEKKEEIKEGAQESFEKVYDSFANLGSGSSDGKMTCENLKKWMKQAGISEDTLDKCVSDPNSTLDMSEVKSTAECIAKENEMEVDEVMSKLSSSNPEETWSQKLGLDSLKEKVMGSGK